MARKLRVEYPGALYHVMNRGDRREPIFKDDLDRRRFVETLGEACAKTAWQVQAYCLMENHFHLVIETPLANLVAGMKWFLGTYTSRFNRRHKLFGHLFSGRYKALIVDGSGNGYLRTVCDYVHLNPVRAKLLTDEQPLRSYLWSSYGHYLQAPAKRPVWLRVERLLGEMGIPKDSTAGRRQFELGLEERRQRDEPEQWKSVERGWCMGDEEFRQELLEQMEPKFGRHHGGPERQQTAASRAERMLAEELKRRSWTSDQLTGRRKGDREKVKIARRLRKETTMTLDWIAQRLNMGAAGYAAQCLRQARCKTCGSAGLTPSSNATTHAAFAYQLGAAGNRTRLDETVNGSNRVYQWSYDSLYRLKNEIITGAGSTGAVAYAHDPVGNRTNRASTLSALTNQVFSYNTNDWLTIDTFDSAGNTRTNAGNPFFYDWANRLTNAFIGTTNVSIVYNGDGQRVKKTVVAGATTTVTLYLVDSRNPSGYAQVMEELSVSGGSTNLVRAYTYGLDLISQRAPNASTNFFGVDGLGSTRLLLNLAGGVSDTYTYDAFGTIVASTGTTTNHYLYAGEQRDADLGGLYYLRAPRYLNTGTGRFTSMDSFEGTSTEPLSLHKYLYAHGNSVNMIDPSGHFTIAQVNVAIGTLGVIAAGTVFAIKSARQSAFIKLFTHGPLGKKLMRHYMDGTGTSITLTIDEMVEVGAMAPPNDGRPSITRTDDFETYRQKLASGPVQIQDMRMRLVATQGATLGQFSAYLSGTLKGSPSDWSFEGTMRYHDFYNFEHHQGGSPVRNILVFGVRSGVNGTPFSIYSELAPVKQASHDRGLQWKGTGKQKYPGFYEN